MINVYTRIASIMLAFGLFISCSTFQSTNKSSTTSQNLSEKELKEHISSIEDELSNNSDNPDLYFQKGKLLTKLAKKSDHPSDRTTSYSQAHEALKKAIELNSNSKQSDKEKAHDLLNVTWSLEHNQGVQLLQGESSTNPDYSRAAAHFKNATTIIPDSAVSYTMQARALYQNQQPEDAIRILENARKEINNPPILLLEKLAFLHLENGDASKAIAIYEEADSFSDQNANLLHGLSNAYISAGKHHEAISLLEQLVENNPQNIIYSQSLVTEYYFAGKQKMDTVIQHVENDRTLEDTEFTIADSLFKMSEEQYSKVAETNPGDEEIMKDFAQFYYNSASTYQELIPLVSDQHETIIQKEIEQYLSASIPLLETITEQNTANQQAWKKLYRAYSILGMQQEAENAKTNL